MREAGRMAMEARRAARIFLGIAGYLATIPVHWMRSTVRAVRGSINGISGRYARTLYARPSDLKMHPFGITLLDEAGIDRRRYGQAWLDDGGSLAGPQAPFSQQGMTKAGIMFSLSLSPEATYNSGWESGTDAVGASISLAGMALPETVLMSLAGRPVEEVVDHPVLAGRGMVIDHAHLDAEGRFTVIRFAPVPWIPIIPDEKI